MNWKIKFIKLKCECGETVLILVFTPESKLTSAEKESFRSLGGIVVPYGQEAKCPKCKKKSPLDKWIK